MAHARPHLNGFFMVGEPLLNGSWKAFSLRPTPVWSKAGWHKQKLALL
jgi:hypothetical protein